MTTLLALARRLTGLTLLVLASCSVVGVPAPHASPRTAATSAAAFDWVDFDASVLERARREHKLILLSVQASFCHWCHVMNATTYRDPQVAALLSRGFIAIRVDQDENPELKQRYLAWGWPATALLTPDAEPIVTLRGHQPASSFTALLSELLARQERGEALRVPRGQTDDTLPATSDLTATLDLLSAQLASYYDDAHGGWGKTQKYPLSAPIQHALFRSAVHADAVAMDHALTTLRGHLALIDPVAGGMYQYSVRGVWTAPHHEKLASIQAGALLDFSMAFAATRDPIWLDAAQRIGSYVLSMLRSPSGAFYASQAADVGRPGEHDYAPGSRYYTLSAESRRTVAAPDLDRHIYADLNGMLIQGLCALYRVSGDERWRSAADEAARTVLHELERGDLVAHEGTDDISAFFLSDQVEMVAALDALADVTPENARQLRGRADEILNAARTRFLDTSSGGFHARNAQEGATGVFLHRIRPLADNARLARLLLTRARLHDEPLLHEEALRTLRSLAVPGGLAEEGRNVADYLLALEHARSPHVMISVVGPLTDPRTKPLTQSALSLFLPQGFVVHFEPGEGRYPYPGEPGVYLCSDSACSSPILEAEALESGVASFLADAS